MSEVRREKAELDRQRVLDELCRRAFRDFVGRKATPALMVEAESTLRRELDDAIRAGNYVLPDGLVVDRVELGLDMRLKVFFGKSTPEISYTKYARVGPEDRVPDEVKLKDRFEAVAAEIDNQEKP